MDESRLLYAESHEWALIEGDVATVGITRFAVEQLVDITYLELPNVGQSVVAGKPFGVVESVKAASDLYAPFSGEVIEVHQSLLDNPADLSKDAYDQGWMIKIRISDPSEKSRLLDLAGYEAKRS